MPARLGALLDRIETEVLPGLEQHVAADRPTTAVWRLGAMTRRVRTSVWVRSARTGISSGARRSSRSRRAAHCDGSIRRSACSHHGAEQHIERVETPAYDGATPEVTVVVTLYDYADLVRETLDSILASEGVAFEVVVVEDHSHDDSRAVVTAYLAEHPDVAMVLLGKDANEGLAAARNTGFGHARAPLVMVVDADNHLYPHCLRRLADALAADPSRELRTGSWRTSEIRPGCAVRSRGSPSGCAGRTTSTRRPCSVARCGRASVGTGTTTTTCSDGRTGTCGCASLPPGAMPASCARSSAATASARAR
jgi:hypothetical protein